MNILKLRSDVLIVPLANCHAENTARWLYDSAISENIGLRNEPSLEKTLKWIEAAQNDISVYPFAIQVGTGHVGNVVLDKLDNYLATARFSIYIGEHTKQNSGVGRTATYLVCKYGFEVLSLNKIWLIVHSQNAAAINSYLQSGFQLEGVLRDEFVLSGKRLSVFYMGLLKNDFEGLKIT